MRTQQQILERFRSENDPLGIQKQDLLYFMDFETAKSVSGLLDEDFVQRIESGKQQWEMLIDPKKQILNYLGFAYDKAYSKRAMSVERSLLHFRTWVWLDDPEFYESIISLVDNHTDYGIPALDAIAEHYGYEKPADTHFDPDDYEMGWGFSS